MSRTNLNPQFWGPSTWKVIHAFAVGFPENPTIEEVNAMSNFLDGLKHLLPCAKCRHHYNDNLKEIGPPPLYSKKDLIRWTFDLHNMVNQMLDKKPYSFEQFEIDFALKNENSTKNSKQNKLFVKVGIIILSLIVVAILYKCFKQKSS